MSNRKELDKKDKSQEGWLDEELVIVEFECIDCKKTDDVPDYIIDECSLDLKKGEEVELECPFCHGTMIKAKNAPSDE
ncbi:hypothetical protein MUO14_20445 [Halobacillus shinanisalinarum]|uniref:Uncharacterized protein n=1 Tax=Halobacillus shinanisalinarum TaxID=2932258 RepID=A0ABY4GX98_9BACI|nr:hypothetical protein [Halobacillus shinanisalinarum]UOQ92758.1 hypothetical protein MUO14_20445 [Halobacillus shinanisalinarum]